MSSIQAPLFNRIKKLEDDNKRLRELLDEYLIDADNFDRPTTKLLMKTRAALEGT